MMDYYSDPTQFLLVGGLPNDKLLTIYRSTSLTAGSLSQDLCHNLFQQSDMRPRHNDKCGKNKICMIME